MDVFYYWRDYDADLAAGRIGWLHASRKRVGDLKERHPDWIWAFRRPKRQKKALQLVARLKWADAPVAKLPIEKGSSAIYYDPAQSVCFSNADEETSVAEVTSIMRARFPNAFLTNFRGDAGVYPMEADLLAQLVPRLSGYSVQPFPGFPVARAPG